MTEAKAPSVRTVGQWLLPGAEDARVRIQRVVTEPGATGEPPRRLHKLATVARRALAQEIETRLRDLLNETLADVVIGGWHSYAAVTHAVEKSLAEPGVDQLVPLRDHTVHADRGHDLDIQVDGVRVLTLGARVDVIVQLYDAVAVVRDGHLTAIRSGQAHATGIVALEGVEISRNTVHFPLSAELVLRHPRDI